MFKITTWVALFVKQKKGLMGCAALPLCCHHYKTCHCTKVISIALVLVTFDCTKRKWFEMENKCISQCIYTQRPWTGNLLNLVWISLGKGVRNRLNYSSYNHVVQNEINIWIFFFKLAIWIFLPWQRRWVKLCLLFPVTD